ncbi:MAG: putative quinol monooxygenase [Pseudomonadota bacterium]
MTPLVILARITPKPHHREDARQAILDILPQTRAEAGCAQFDLCDGEGDDRALYLVERWADDAALTAHYAQPYVQRVFEAYERWLAHPPEITRLRPVED